MASVPSASDSILSSSTSLEVADVLHKLSLDRQNKSLQVPDSRKKTTAVQYSPVESGTSAIGLNRPYERSTTSFHQDFMDPSMIYNPSGYPSSTYYYGAYDGSVNDWDRFSTPDGAEQVSGVYGEYHGYTYAPYGAYSPTASSMGHDGQLYGPQQYQYPTSYFQPSTQTSGSYAPNQINASVPSVAEVQSQAETANGNMPSVGNFTAYRSNLSKPLRPYDQNSTMNCNDSYGWGGLPSASSGISSAVSHGYNFSTGRNHNQLGLQPPGGTSGLGATGFPNQVYANHKIYGQYASSGGRFAPNRYYPRTNSHGWLAVDNKYSSKGRGSSLYGNSNESMDGFNELNRGPRAKGLNDLKDAEPITLPVKGLSLPLKGNDKNNLPLSPDRQQYNKEDFPEKYADAKFFIIKSYSEDDVHKSIKYGVWASTPNGNKKLDAAYKESQEKSAGCPLFLLYSVNASGQFVGLAEMVGPVDFDNSLEYWQQDKWSGCFPVKWHIVKDVPNSLLRHITLENNENKPVTNSRDIQEVGIDQGIQIIKIFKGHSSKTCILDDFEFYEGRQKTMVEKKAKQRKLKVANVEIRESPSTEDVDKNGHVGKLRENKIVPATLNSEAAACEIITINGEHKVL
ncbi:YTH domain-containing family protein 1-like isoform X2 [Olea europaea var. sylvestris]|uniref:YTH domain-containing family protein 1-like isoform X2 n=1 Tax=Olea europaea var. sylvestris TaxID=158386 RepID=UPI000C1D51A2|nr:YTH domain-containing family protein 1-like isoform X2 [Olea europaea var. sylvestris]